ncbi:MAG: sialate O-acetylesterase, partial [Armatimonadota bacterium]|nr:sialate O-acetylesterase [Armatimonadota bacterium]
MMGLTTRRSRSGVDGRWMAKIGPFAAGGPYTLTITGPQTVTFKNVLVGDVWICSGQSNMSFGIGGSVNGAQEIAEANYPEIRLYTVPNRISMEPQSDLNSHWDVCSPQTVGVGGWNGFTAVGYFFGRDLYQKLKIPIGLIHSSWGGTVAEAWTSAPALSTMTDFKPRVADFQKNVDAQKNGSPDFQKTMADWYGKVDPGSAAGASWSDPAAKADD